MNIGIIRRADSLRRIVIPKELRDFFRLGRNEPVEIIATEQGILMPYRKEAEAVETSITESFNEEMKKLYEVVREHHIYHETVCPKLAHYLGLIVKWDATFEK